MVLHKEQTGQRGIQESLPSLNELKELQKIESQGRSAMFDLSLEQLLKETRIKYEHHTGLDDVLKSLYHILKDMKQESQQVSEDCLQLKGIRLKNYIKRKEVVLPFHSPERIDIIGSHLLRAGTKLNFNVDVAIQMPDKCFLPKDFQNFRYFDKRMLYIGVIASAIAEQSESFSNIRLEAASGHREHPILVLDPNYSAKHGDKCLSIRLFPVINEGVFKHSKLIPSRCNIKCGTQKATPTPRYNNKIVKDMYMKQHLHQLHKVSKECPAFLNTIIICKVWIHQRGFQKMDDSINGFVLSMYLLYLVHTQRINRRMSEMQMFKVLLNFFATEIFDSKVHCFESKFVSSSTIEEFRASYPITLLDFSGRCNIAANISPSALHELQSECRRSIQLLHDSSVGAFQNLFVHRSTFWTRYDQYVWVPTPASFDGINDYSGGGCHSYITNEEYWALQVANIAAKALTDRVEIIRPCIDFNTSKQWSLNEAPFGFRGIVLAFKFNVEKCCRLVDKGPRADNKSEATDFRMFWKGKSELRRFKDGTILEAVLWNFSVSSRVEILEEILKFILPQHLPLDRSDISSSSSLRIDTVSISDGLVIERTLRLWKEFDFLVKKLRTLQHLPLAITSVLPADAAFRYTSPNLPVQNPLAFSSGEQQGECAGVSKVELVITPVTVVIELESSSKWPKDINAIRQTKVAMLAQIANELENDGVRCRFMRNSVDIFYGGYAFRIMLISGPDLSLFSGAIEQKKDYLNLIYQPKHSALVHGLHARYKSYGNTVRIVNYWLESCFMASHIPHEAVELIVAHIFLSSRCNVPTTAFSGLMHFLRFVSHFDWKTAPLIVDFHGDLTECKRREILKDFSISKNLKSVRIPSMCIVATDYEVSAFQSSWTSEKPESVVLSRLCQEAMHANEKLEKWLILGCSKTKSADLLKPKFSGFDVVIKINLKFDTKNSQNAAFRTHYYKNTNLNKAAVLVDFDPVKDYLRSVKQEFGSIAIFFTSELNRNEIFVNWRPQMFMPQKFNVGKARWMLPLNNSNGSIKLGFLQIDLIMREMKELGFGIVNRVDLLKNKC